MDMTFRTEPLKFYFSFNDPYSFLISPAFKSFSQQYRVHIEYVPLGGFDNTGLFSADEKEQAYYKADAARYAEKAMRKLNYIDSPQDSSRVCRALHLAEESILGVKYINLVFAARWQNAIDISDTGAVMESLKFLEMDANALREALETEKYAETVEKSERMAEEDGVFGVPFYVFRGERFYGPDRLSYLEDLLKRDPDLKIHHDATYSVMQPEELQEFFDKGRDVLVLDVRIPKDFGKAHIPGANCVPAKVVYKHMNQLDRDWRIVLVDDGGVDGNEVGFMLATEGFAHVSVLAGGFPAWKGATESGLENWRDKLGRK